jgi:hypothetical protein
MAQSPAFHVLRTQSAQGHNFCPPEITRYAIDPLIHSVPSQPCRPLAHALPITPPRLTYPAVFTSIEVPLQHIHDIHTKPPDQISSYIPPPISAGASAPFLLRLGPSFPPGISPCSCKCRHHPTPNLHVRCQSLVHKRRRYLSNPVRHTLVNSPHC